MFRIALRVDETPAKYNCYLQTFCNSRNASDDLRAAAVNRLK